MAGPHLDALITECFLDVQGREVWKGFYLGGEQWWVGWHTTTPFHNGNLGKPCNWFLIGYEKWCHNRRGHAYLAEAYYQEPNPSTSRPDADLTPVGQRYVAYNDHGQRAYIGYLGEPLMFPKGKGALARARARRALTRGRAKANITVAGVTKANIRWTARATARPTARAQAVFNRMATAKVPHPQG